MSRDHTQIFRHLSFIIFISSLLFLTPTVFGQSITITEYIGSGEAGVTFDITGTGFLNTAITPANFTVGGQQITAPASFTPSGGAFSETVTLPAIGTAGIKDVIIQGNTFAGRYRVASATLSEIAGNGNAHSITITGMYFKPSHTFTSGNVTIGGRTISTSISTDATGNFNPNPTTVNLPTLSKGVKNLVFTVDGFDVTFTNAYTVSPAIDIVEYVGSGEDNVQFSITGTGFDDATTISQANFTVGGQAIKNISFNSSNGSFTRTISLNAYGTAGLKNVTIQAVDFGNAYRVASLTLNPTFAVGNTTQPNTISGTFFGSGDTIANGDITIGGSPATGFSFSTDGSGNFSGQVITIPILSGGYKDVAFRVENTFWVTFSDKYRVPSISLSDTNGNGAASGNTTTITGSGFPTSTSVSLLIGGRAPSPGTASTSGTGTINQSVTVPALWNGDQDVVVDGVTFADRYAVFSYLNTVSPEWSDGSETGVQLSGTGFENAAISSVTVSGVATTYSAPTLTFGTFNNFAVTFGSAPALGYHTIVINQSGPHTFTNRFRVEDITAITPTSGSGNAGNNLNIDGLGFDGPSFGNSVQVDTITIGGRTPTFTPVNAGANGVIDINVSLPYLPRGTHTVVVEGSSYSSYTVNPTVSPSSRSGNGALNNTFSVSGTGFVDGNLAANSIDLVGTPSYNDVTHLERTIEYGHFNSVTVTLPAMQMGTYQLAIGGETFNNYYEVIPDLNTVTPTTGYGSAAETVSLAGTGFRETLLTSSPPVVDDEAGGTFGTPTSYTHSNGTWSATLDLPLLEYGDYAISVGGETFSNEYHVRRALTCVPSIGNGEANDFIRLSGTGFQDSLISGASNIRVGEQDTTYTGFPPVSGAFNNQQIDLPGLSSGTKTIRIQGQDFSGLFRVASVSLNPPNGNGLPNSTTVISGSNFTPASVIPANSIKIGGYSLTHTAITVSGSGNLPSTTLTLPGMGLGDYDLVIQDSGVPPGAPFNGVLTFTDRFTVGSEIMCFPGSGYGQQWRVTHLTGTGFTNGLVIPQNSITFHGFNVRHNQITIGSNGLIDNVELILPYLPMGMQPIVIDSVTYNNEYYVSPKAVFEPRIGPQTAPFILYVHGYGFPPGTIPQHSMKFRDVTTGFIESLNHYEIVVGADGYMTTTQISPQVPNIRRGWKHLIISYGGHNITIEYIYGAGIGYYVPTISTIGMVIILVLMTLLFTLYRKRQTAKAGK